MPQGAQGAAQTFAVVPSPPVEPPRVGLIASVSGPFLDPPDTFPGFESPASERSRPVTDFAVPPGPAGRNPGAQRWEGGFQYAPEQTCLTADVTDPCYPTMTTIEANPDLVQNMPGLVWAGDRCSTFGWSSRDYIGRATRALLATESKQIAHELWTGEQATASGWPNVALASSSAFVLNSSPLAPRDALACLEDALGDCSNGQRGMIHCTRQVAMEWSELGSTFRSVNGLILTYMDSIIVPDAGYDGSGPNGEQPSAGHVWAYATLMVTVRRGPIEISPGTFEEAMIRGTNDIEFRAQRLASASFPSCCHLAVEIDLPKCNTPPGSS